MLIAYIDIFIKYFPLYNVFHWSVITVIVGSTSGKNFLFVVLIKRETKDLTIAVINGFFLKLFPL